MPMKNERARNLNTKKAVDGDCVIYWMSRDQRVEDNWALLYAQELAQEQNIPLMVVFALSHNFLGATLRQYDFMLHGLAEVREKLNWNNIPFLLLQSEKKVPEMILDSINQYHPAAVVTDFSPLKIGRQWREYVAQQSSVPVFEVDSHNIIPAWITSSKQEFAAHTIRLKIYKLLNTYLEQFPKLQKQEKPPITSTEWSIENVLEALTIDTTVPAVDWITPGESAALDVLDNFITYRLQRYNNQRNDPNENALSNLSPYLHFGQISAQRIALEIVDATGKGLQPKLIMIESSAEAFLEELIVRRELADNYCLYNSNYDSIQGAPEWGIKTLHEHREDVREIHYSLAQLEQGATHDTIWNTAQREMVNKGKMHGYMRMYWAKKLLEWTESPEQAIEYAVYLNDKYELDGRDPNGYVGILWSIAGLHDRPWFERAIFGKVRYMSANGLKTKFDTEKYSTR